MAILGLSCSDQPSSKKSESNFNAAQPPRPLLADLHGVLDGLVEQFGIVTHGTDRTEGGRGSVVRRVRQAAQLAEQQACGLGHGVIDGSEPAVADGGFDRAFQALVERLELVRSRSSHQTGSGCRNQEREILDSSRPRTEAAVWREFFAAEDSDAEST